MEVNIIINKNNIKFNDINKQYYNIKLDIDISIKNLVIFILFNWHLIDIINSFAFSIASYI